MWSDFDRRGDGHNAGRDCIYFGVVFDNSVVGDGSFTLAKPGERRMELISETQE